MMQVWIFMLCILMCVIAMESVVNLCIALLHAWYDEAVLWGATLLVSGAGTFLAIRYLVSHEGA